MATTLGFHVYQFASLRSKVTPLFLGGGLVHIMGYEWHQQLSVGNDLIDSDHRHLIELINRVQSRLGAAEGLVLTPAIDEFAKFLDMHFLREDKLVRATCGAAFAQQIYESHLALLINLKRIQKECIGDPGTVSIQRINQFIGDLMGHLVDQELLMKPELSKFPSSLVPE